MYPALHTALTVAVAITEGVVNFGIGLIIGLMIAIVVNRGSEGVLGLVRVCMLGVGIGYLTTPAKGAFIAGCDLGAQAVSAAYDEFRQLSKKQEKDKKTLQKKIYLAAVEGHRLFKEEQKEKSEKKTGLVAEV